MSTILITGSTDGIGKHTALKLAQKGNRVIIHGRTQKKCQDTLKELLEAVPNAELDMVVADFSDLGQVRNMVGEVKQRFPDVQVLLNNAGVFAPAYTLSADGFELSWAVNYLALVVLTEGLFETLQENAPARIINFSSIAHKRGRLDFDHLVIGEEGYNGYHAYSNSKLAVTIYTNFLSNRFDPKVVSANSLHPGVITTKMLRIGFNMEGDSLDVGTETPVFLAVSDEVEEVSGQFFDQKQSVPASKYAYDVDVQAKLWRETEKMIK